MPSSQSPVLSRTELVARLEELRKKNESAEKVVAERDEEIQKLRVLSVETQRVAEVEEERMGNTLLKRMDSLKRRNMEIERSIKAGEAKNAAVLGELAAVRKNKVDVENRIEAEQERMLNTLQKQLVALAAEKASLERQLHSGREEVLATLQQEVDRLRSRAQTPAPASADLGNLSLSQHLSSPLAQPATPPLAVAVTPNSASQTQSRESSSSRPRRGSVVQLENELRNMLAEARAAQAACDAADEQYHKLTDNLRSLQNDSFLAKARMAKIKEDLERAQAELAAEQASNAATPRRHSTDSTPLASSTGGLAGAHTAIAIAAASPQSTRRGSHIRTHSGSSVESWASSSMSSSAPSVVNVGLARKDARKVRQHTAKVLSSVSPVYPSPQRGGYGSDAPPHR